MDNNDNAQGSLGGFQSILDDVIGKDYSGQNYIDDNNIGGEDDLSDEEIATLKTKRAPSIKDVFDGKDIDTKKNEVANDDDDDNDDEEETVEDAPKDAKKEKTTKKETVEEKEESIEKEEDEIEEDGSPVITSLFDAIAENLGWEFSEEEGSEKPKTVEELVTYFKEVIEDNSVPVYANDEVKEIDEFVRNGGKITDYFNTLAQVDYTTLDITKEENQRKVVSAVLKEKGWDDAKISKKLDRYEDAGVLEDEAEEAMELLKSITSEKKEALLEDQKNKAVEAKEKQQKFYTDVVNGIKNMSEIRGIKIAKEDKPKFADYIFKPDANGITQYQKDYSKDIKNLLESAYFTWKGDVVINSAKSEGNSSAMQRLKNSLKTTNAGKSTRRINVGSSEPIWVSVAQQLNNK